MVVPPRRRVRPRGLVAALAASVVLHLGGVLFLLVREGRAEPQTNYRVYQVDIVSPPPNRPGPPPAEAVGGGTPAAGEEAPAPAEPEPEPEPPAPEPTPPPPAPPRETAPVPPRREPERRPEPTRTPTPPREAQRPPARPSTPPAPPQPAPGTRPGPNTGATGSGRAPATGTNPAAGSSGGEGLTLQTAGMTCPSSGYCENIVRQVRRYFRRPDGQAGRAEVCFVIQRDGGADGIEARNVRGSFAFRLAVLEAVEQAGNRRAFGALPDAFHAATLPVCVEITPQL